MIVINTERLIYIEKKEEFRNENSILMGQFKELLGVEIEDLRILNKYIVSGLDEKETNVVGETLIGERNIEDTFYELPERGDYACFGVSLLKGQFDQRADSAEQCIKLLYPHWSGRVSSSKVYMYKGVLSSAELEKIKNYLINEVDSCEVDPSLSSIEEESVRVGDIEKVTNFRNMSEKELEELGDEFGIALNTGDLKHIQKHFLDIQRDPTETEIKVLDTYWSDHCRHTTFNTKLTSVEFEEGGYSDVMKEVYDDYLNIRKGLNRQEKPVTLMDMAVIGMRELKRLGHLDDLDISEEINACSINIEVDNDGKKEDWLLMFKNETHNHPTEIEPFGGASTCVGGAIRDPLSGRSYVYGAMRVTGSGDPREKIDDTLSGKLPQIKITTEAARGYSSYGNQIGLATGLVSEIYDSGYKAKRMEVGAVIGAAPKENVIRLVPQPGDRVLLIGGRTGRDGVGGASGSSKEHNEESIEKCGAEVQKGNPPMERKIQRLFRNPKASKLIKRCNDFGAGGVAVAVGEIADGIFIELDKVRKKYDGLDGTELAISESQERMAVVVQKEHVQEFISYCHEENVECYEIAEVTRDRRMVIMWNGQKIVDLDRGFLDTNGAESTMEVYVESPKGIVPAQGEKSMKDRFVDEVESLERCSQRGLVDQFDSSIGAGSVMMPFGGKYEGTPIQTMVHKLPVPGGKTDTVSFMSYGFNLDVSKWSPFHGGMISVLESISKMVASGADYRKIRLSFQEYFQRLNRDKEKWGKPFAAILGAMKSQMEFKTAAIGGKDSMSGTFKDIDVPPTLISFGVCAEHLDNVVTPELKETGSKLVLLKVPFDSKMMPDFEVAREIFETFRRKVEEGVVKSAYSISGESIYSSLCKMAFGNRMGMTLSDNFEKLCGENLFGSIVCEVGENCFNELEENAVVIGEVTEEFCIHISDERIELGDLQNRWEKPLEDIFPIYSHEERADAVEIKERRFDKKIYIRDKDAAKPKIIIPVFPGTNCEYDSLAAFESAGGDASTFVFKNLSEKDIVESIDNLKREIDGSKIIMLPGGFSAGDEPDGSGKFISAIFRNEKIRESVMEMLYKRDGLMLGVCNGFQALVKLGLVPYGDIREVAGDAPTLTHNCGRKHISRIAKTRVVSNKSPWLSGAEVGEVYSIPISHGEGRLYAKEEVLRWMEKNGQIATVYEGGNPNGSVLAVEGITSPDGRILGKMGHSERIGKGLYKNVYGKMDQKIFESGVNYYK